MLNQLEFLRVVMYYFIHTFGHGILFLYVAGVAVSFL